MVKNKGVGLEWMCGLYSMPELVTDEREPYHPEAITEAICGALTRLLLREEKAVLAACQGGPTMRRVFDVEIYKASVEARMEVPYDPPFP